MVTSDFVKFDLILAMDRQNMTTLRRLCPLIHHHKLHLFLAFTNALDAAEIHDPYFGNAAGFEQVLALCEKASQGLLNYYTR
jgi:protein-tyrosine phosphatase